MRHYSELRRLETVVVAAARRRGYRGDPFAETPPMLTTLGHELAAIDIYLDVPKAVREIAPAVARGMTRAIVHTASQNVEHTSQAILQGQTRAPASVRLAQARRRA